MLLLLTTFTALAGVVETARGPVDVTITGEGPAVLVFHGAPGGSDQGELLAPLAEAGFQVLALSRPGYLDTPLSSGATYAAQGDLAAALLDALGLDQAAAVGLSAGGPAALAFAARHPDRSWALVLEAAVVDAYVPPDQAENELLGRLILSPLVAGPTFRMLRRNMLRHPERAAARLLALESTLDAPAREACAAQLGQDPVPWAALADSFVPYRHRRAGLRNDLTQLAGVDAADWSGLSAPTLLQYSPSDADVPVRHAQALLDQGVDATLVLHPSACGHFLWLGPSSEAVAAERLAFLSAHSP
ncbi:MAG: alpha/beta hydrolase [Alphaproteobacteria bacterium]|nr:alpha/beta hydrolase [Alphaproteobacteria bacterium]